MYQTRKENGRVKDLSGKGKVSESMRTSKNKKVNFFFLDKKREEKIKALVP